MSDEQTEPDVEGEKPAEEELPDLDYADPAKREPGTETQPGLDPIVTIPPE